MTKIDVPCPKCQANAGEKCRRVNGSGRVATHQERVKAASEALGGTKSPIRRQSRVVKRFGAFLMMYGPKDAPTHAVLKMGHGPEPDTPRGFLLELESQEQTERHGRMHGIGTEWRMHFSGRPRETLPKNPVRVYRMAWQRGVSLPPLKCAGRKQFATYSHATLAIQGRLLRWYPCPYCKFLHLKKV